MASTTPQGRAAARSQKGAKASPRHKPKAEQPVDLLDPDLEPGAPDPVDVAETAQPLSAPLLHR